MKSQVFEAKEVLNWKLMTARFITLGVYPKVPPLSSFAFKGKCLAYREETCEEKGLIISCPVKVVGIPQHALQYSILHGTLENDTFSWLVGTSLLSRLKLNMKSLVVFSSWGLMTSDTVCPWKLGNRTTQNLFTQTQIWNIYINMNSSIFPIFLSISLEDF